MNGNATSRMRLSALTDAKLAIDGGAPAIRHPLPPMYPGGMRLGAVEENAVLDVLRSKRLFRYYGPNPGASKVEQLESKIRSRIDSRHAVAVSSGFGALACGLAAIGAGPGDEVIVPAYTWIASAEAVICVGAVPILAEVDQSLTLDPADVASKITPRTKAIMPVHMRGAACRMQEIMDLARSRGIKVLEDVAQAMGGAFRGRPLGGIGDIGAFSFQFNKIITCGEGGAVVTNDDELHRRMVMYHDVIGGQRAIGSQQQLLNGMNFRMSELHGAILLVQLERLEGLLAEMQRRKAALKSAIRGIAEEKDITFRTINDRPGDTAIALIFFAPTAERAVRISSALNAEGVPSFVIYEADRVDYHIFAHWEPILQQRTWSANGGPWCWHEGNVKYSRDMCPHTLELLGRAVHLDISPDLTDENVEELSDAIIKVLSALL